MERLVSFGEDRIVEMIFSGSTQDEISKLVGVGVGSLNTWLHAVPERSARAREAMSASAEAWLDRGFDALNSAPPDNAEIARARAIEQHCARRAAIRNPKYGEKKSIEHSGKVGLESLIAGDDDKTD